MKTFRNAKITKCPFLALKPLMKIVIIFCVICCSVIWKYTQTGIRQRQISGNMLQLDMEIIISKCPDVTLEQQDHAEQNSLQRSMYCLNYLARDFFQPSQNTSIQKGKNITQPIIFISSCVVGKKNWTFSEISQLLPLC